MAQSEATTRRVAALARQLCQSPAPRKARPASSTDGHLRGLWRSVSARAAVCLTLPHSRRPQVLDLKYSAEVGAALAEGRAVVALESTIISHGAPRALAGASALSLR